MAKMRVNQLDGEITYTPGDRREPMVFQVVKGYIEVPDEAVAELSRHLDVPNLSPEEQVAEAEQAGFEAEKKRQAEVKNAQAVADATATGAARAAKDLSKAV